VAEAERLIQGKIEEVIGKLSNEMNAAAEDMQFERAAELRDLIAAVKTLAEHQKADTCDGDDRDVLGLAREKDEALIQVFFIREGKLSGREHLMMQGVEGLPDGEIFAAFIKQFYGEAAFIPKELALPAEPTEKREIQEWLAQIKGRSVAINVPQRGEKRKMVELAQTNAGITMEQFGAHIKREAEKNIKALNEIAELLGMEQPPARIEAYDISNIQGFESVGSMVAFENGQAKNSDYRKFKIKGVLGPDDYASMDEVITRRFTRYINDKDEKFSKLPDLVMIDGGKGQINAAIAALTKLSMSLPVCGMVKDDRHRTRGLMYNNGEIEMDKHSEGFKLVTRIQDEVHRFAVEYHRKLRADAQVHSVLDEIKGVGPARRKALMRHFKNIEAIRAAAKEELAAVDSMNTLSAEAVYNYFHA
jgi:excinuclease ABC subunit C